MLVIKANLWCVYMTSIGSERDHLGRDGAAATRLECGHGQVLDGQAGGVKQRHRLGVWPPGRRESQHGAQLGLEA